MEGPGDIRRAMQYHERTKHAYGRFARSLGYMDWANQPDPFRRWAGTSVERLPFAREDPDGGEPWPFDVPSIGSFLELSMGLSAWKSAGASTWPLRMNPSSGNLHPTETHLVIPPVADHPARLVHYQPLVHALEVRAEVPDAAWRGLASGGRGLLVGLTSIFWRESWKYGERAFRYCNHDVGHALAALAYSARLHGWMLTCLEGASDDEIASVLGLAGVDWPEGEEEHPDLLAWVHEKGQGPVGGLRPGIADAFGRMAVVGEPGRLGREHVAWDAIDEVAVATRKPVTAHVPVQPATGSAKAGLVRARTIRARRSGVDFDGRTETSRASFEAMMAGTLPDVGAPFDCGLGPARVHLAVFVHRVRGLDPGLYALVRDPGDLEDLVSATSGDFEWRRASDPLPLYVLREGDWQERAIRLSCGQDIAGDSTFSLGMLARFSGTLERGAWLYRRLFWETGMIGQALYLGAEEHGLRGTGIGCFFDDPVHETLGLDGDGWESLYHFTVGGAVEDPRLRTLAPYHHLENRDDPRFDEEDES